MELGKGITGHVTEEGIVTEQARIPNDATSVTIRAPHLSFRETHSTSFGWWKALATASHCTGRRVNHTMSPQSVYVPNATNTMVVLKDLTCFGVSHSINRKAKIDCFFFPAGKPRETGTREKSKDVKSDIPQQNSAVGRKS